MQNSPSGSQKLMVNVATLGDSNEYPIDIPTIVDAIDPTSGSTAGGTRLTISGFGNTSKTIQPNILYPTGTAKWQDW